MNAREARGVSAGVHATAAAIRAAREALPWSESMIVAVSGIDASGKGYVTERLVTALAATGLNAVCLSVDDWYDPRWTREHGRSPERFYRHGFRFDELFERLVVPLKRHRSVRLDDVRVDEAPSSRRNRAYEYRDVDVVVLEGIYLLKIAFRQHYDMSIWVRCSFEKALVRALRRRQEGLSFDETVNVYRAVYFPAQLIHLAVDDPENAADIILDNDGVPPRAG